MTLKYGLIGAGMMGAEHVRNVALLDDVSVTAVSDPNDELAIGVADLAGATRYVDHQSMLASEDLDALIVAAPNHTHHKILENLLRTDLPILCEKPLGVTVEECIAIRDWVTAQNAALWVAMEYRYMPPLQRLITETKAGRAGNLHMLTIREHRYPFLDKVGYWNRFNSQTGGTLVEKCCHHFDLMRLILGSDPARVYASGAMSVNHKDETIDGRTPDILDNAYVIVDFESGQRGMLELSMFAEGAYWQEIISAVGDKARIEAKIPGPARFSADGGERSAELCIADRASKIETTEKVETDVAILGAGDHHGSTFYQHQKFHQMVRHGGSPEVNAEDGLIAVAIGAAAELSAQTGQPVDMKQFMKA